MLTRRELLNTLNGAAMVALSQTVPDFLARTARAAAPRRDGRGLATQVFSTQIFSTQVFSTKIFLTIDVR